VSVRMVGDSSHLLQGQFAGVGERPASEDGLGFKPGQAVQL
jgi:hypothetical protein